MVALRSSTVADVVRRSAYRSPDRVALRFAERVWTYRELDEAVTRAAGALRGLGLDKGDRVAAYGKNSDAYVIAFLGCARAGLVHVPINYNLTGDELAYLLEQSGSRAVLVDPSLIKRLEALEHRPEHTLALREDENSLLARCRAGALPELDIEVDEADLVQLLYTSGTTSRPKGAMMTHRALVHEYASCVAALGCHAGDEPLHAMPL